jgi:hypothetical protein
MYICMYVRTYVCMYVCTYARTHARTHIRMYVCVYYVHTHTHTHTYVYCLIVVHIDGEEIMTENLSSSPMTLKSRSYAGVNMIYSQKGHLFILKFQSYNENMTNAFTLWYIKLAKLCT